MNMKTSVSETQRELLRRIQTEGVEAAYEASLAICQDAKAPPNARATASSTLFRVAGYFEQRENRQSKEPHEMTNEEITETIARLSEQTVGAAAARDYVDSIFD